MIESWLITVLLKCGANVVAIDSWNDYYQCSIKMHTAQADVRPSMLESDLFYSENVLGTENMFRLGIELNTQNIVFASSSAVYWKMKDGICSETLELAPSESFKEKQRIKISIFVHAK
ncbi:MAG: hypothetical protein EZS28_027772 [Streblomastix strix]|uniref:NAD-dependent epimerase/dehydratase domain-containing protein n=1 Tax=Streblomastix strix TaxID=222440 RepID=A0A5J4V3T1_9EUKA|nr:MAG: hypothetical protein EZS28_027772 [Streblomastix strix]